VGWLDMLSTHLQAVQRGVHDAFIVATLTGVDARLHLRTHLHTHVIMFHISAPSYKKDISQHTRVPACVTTLYFPWRVMYISDPRHQR
jgi:hypothetical protein